MILAVFCGGGVALAAPTITEYQVPTHNRQPSGIAAGPDGNVWFVQSVAPGGVGRSTLTGGMTEFTAGLTGGAQGITPGADGNLWFTEPSAGKIGRITPTGTITEFSSAKGSMPTEIAVGSDGNLWITEPGGSGAIGRITTSGTITEFTAGLTKGSQPTGITAGPDGNLWFTESGGSGAIGRITTSGTITEFSAGLTKNSQPEGITAGPDGNLWFTESANPGRIGRITTSGTITEFTTGLTQNVGPRAITTANDGNMYFTEPFNFGKIGEITPAGVITEQATPTSFSQPEDITTGPDGNLWFTEAANPGKIVVMTVAPKVSATSVSGVAEQSAKLEASVGPNSQATTYRFEYGPTSSYGSQTTSTSAGSGASSAAVSSTVSGLSAATDYHFRAVATNGTGTTHGPDRTFTTTTPPAAITQPATAVTLTGGTLNGTVNPEGQATTYHFDWGATASYGSKTPAVDEAVGADTSKHQLGQGITGLSPDQTYHFRIVASNCGGCAEGTTYGPDQSFTTASPPADTTEEAEHVTLTTATVTGTVNPSGAATTYHFDWGENTAYGNQTPTPETSAGSDSSVHEVEQGLSGLHPGTVYHYRIVATNCGGCVPGTVYGSDQTFMTTAPPAAATESAEAVGLHSATVIGTVDPRGTATTYHFEWGETAAYGDEGPAVDALVGADETEHRLGQVLTELAPGRTYHYRIVASDCEGCVAGTVYGTDRTFATLPAPAVETESPRAVGRTSATLVAAVNPLGSTTTYRFEWGETNTYGSRTPVPDAAVGSDSAAHEVTQDLTGLSPNTTYHYRVVASDCGGCSSGTTYGADVSVTTGRLPSVLAELPLAPGASVASIHDGSTTGIAPPALGHTAVAKVLAGTITVQAPGKRSLEPFTGAGDIPMGSLIDAQNGRLHLTAALDSHGHTQAATVWGGSFVIEQVAAHHGMTTFALPRGKPGGCLTRGGRQAGVAAAARAKSRQTVSSLWASDNHGHFSTRGQNSVATVRGTYWGTVERCDGTLTIVKRGVVSVRSLHAERTVLVRAGHSYLARP